jgi:hypothetical protein
MIKYGKGKLPSLNQIEAGLIAEAMVQIEQSMSNIEKK